MIKSIYFPFTYIPEPAAMILSRFLGSLTLLQPVLHQQPAAFQNLVGKALINIEVPYADDEDYLTACSRDFNEWGRLHHGEETSLKDAFEGGFSSQSFTAQIRSDILKKGEQDTFETDPVFSARLFLLMAQDLDVNQDEVDSGLASSIDEELALFTSMTGEEKAVGEKGRRLSEDDSGAYMTGSRIAAWTRIFKAEGDDPVFLVTGSPAVRDEMTDKISGLQSVAYLKDISIEQPEAVKKQFAKCLFQMGTTPWNGPDQVRFPAFSAGSGQTMNLHIYVLPDTPPEALVNYFSKVGMPINPNDNSQLNTVIGCFEI